MDCCAQIFYKILEFVKVGKSAKKIACICSLNHFSIYDMRPFDKCSSALRASLHSLAAQVSTCKYAVHGFSTKFWNLEKLENLPKKLHVYVYVGGGGWNLKFWRIKRRFAPLEIILLVHF